MAAIYAAQGCDAASLKAKGFDAHAVFWHAGFSVPSLKAAGYSAKQLKEAEIDAAALTAAGFDVQELRAAGFGARALREAGFDASELRAEGYDARSLKKAGFDASAFHRAGVSPDEIRAIFDIPADVKEAVGRQFAPNTLKAAGFSARLLHEEVSLHDWTVDVIPDPFGSIAFEGHCEVCGETWSHVQGFGGAAPRNIYNLRVFHQTGCVQLTRQAEVRLAQDAEQAQHCDSASHALF